MSKILIIFNMLFKFNTIQYNSYLIGAFKKDLVVYLNELNREINRSMREFLFLQCFTIFPLKWTAFSYLNEKKNPFFFLLFL